MTQLIQRYRNAGMFYRTPHQARSSRRFCCPKWRRCPPSDFCGFGRLYCQCRARRPQIELAKGTALDVGWTFPVSWFAGVQQNLAATPTPPRTNRNGTRACNATSPGYSPLECDTQGATADRDGADQLQGATLLPMPARQTSITTICCWAVRRTCSRAQGATSPTRPWSIRSTRRTSPCAT
jgi:hypothetical protein